MGNNSGGGFVKSTHRSRCRICGSNKLTPYLNLGDFPLANNLESTYDGAINKERFSLAVNLCENCGLSQLSEVVNPALLYSTYWYRSSVSKTYVEHCRNMAIELKNNNDLCVGSSADFIVDVAGNDGTLLEQFKAEMPSLKVLNIDPSINLGRISRDKGIPTFTQFLNINTALEVIISYGRAAVITATNVICHVDDIRQFMLSCKVMLQHNGIIILEFPYIVDHIQNLEYSTLYHEHLSYMGITPLNRLCNECGLKIIKVESKNIHCGTVRVTIAHDFSNREVCGSVNDYISYEEGQGFNSIERYRNWEVEVMNSVAVIKNTVSLLKEEGKTIIGFGASAKGNTLLNACKFTDDDIRCIVDDTPEKQGMYSPGTGIPIYSPESGIGIFKPDYIMILAWNFKDEIMKRLAPIYNGKYIIPTKELQIV